MAEGNNAGGGDGGVREEGPTSAENRSAWVRSHLADSIYLWACGEKAEHEEDEPKISDRLIGWIVLGVQGFAYGMLIILCGESQPIDSSVDDSSISTSTGGSTASSFRSIDGRSSDSDTKTPYLFPAVIGAVYLLIGSTTHDLRAGYSLLVDGESAGHRTFGVGLLAVYVIMISAAMKVLMSTSEDSASVVLNAVTVIFIADLDERALKFLSRVPQKWRLFWAIYSIGVSFFLAVVVFVSSGDSALELGSIEFILSSVPKWLVWIHNPVAVTIFCYRLSAGIQHVSEAWSKAFQNVEHLTIVCIVTTGFGGSLAGMKHAKECVRDEPWFYAAVGAWVVQGIASWGLILVSGSPVYGWPFAVAEVMYVVSWGEYRSGLNRTNVALILSSTVLATGLALKAFGAVLRRHTVVAVPDPLHSTARNRAGMTCRSWTIYRVSSLLIGWGIGFWITSLLVALGTAWHEFGPFDRPIAVQVITYTFLPCLAFASFFMAADANFLGAKTGTFIKPAVDVINNGHSIVYWTMATVFRDIIISWMLFWGWVVYFLLPLFL